MKQRFKLVVGVLLLPLCFLVLAVMAEFAKAAPSISSSILKGYPGQMIPAVTTTIANGQTASAVVQLNGFSLVGIYTPAALTGTALTFQASNDGTNFFPVKTSTSGTALSYTVTTSSYYAINPQDFYGIQYLKIVSGSTEGGARTLTLALKGI